MKQHLTLKPTKRGFKVWVVAESENECFMDVKVYMYVGKEDGETEHGLGERVVLALTKDYRRKAHYIYYDNFFSSPALFQAPQVHTLCMWHSTTDSKRVPVGLRGIRLQLGESDYHQCGALTAVVWKDKRPNHVPSSLSQPGEMETVSQTEGWINGTHFLPLSNCYLYKIYG